MSSGRRFESLTDEDLEKLIESKDSNNTKQVVKTTVRLLEEYLSVKDNLGVKTVTEMDTASVRVMTLTLRKFYAELEKVFVYHCAKQSLVTIRYGLQKHLLKTRKEDIINSNMYKDANEMFKAVLVSMKKAGIGEAKQKEHVEPEDIEKLYSCDAFSLDTAPGLQRKVIFEYLYFFCNRGRENLREVKKDDF